MKWVCSMRLAKISNKYMYKTKKNDNGSHYYLVFYDRKNKRYNAVQLTHLYIKDRNRFVQVNKGLIVVEKFKEFEVPSGVKKQIYETDVNGNNIDIKSNSIRFISKRYLSSKQSNRIKKQIIKKPYTSER